ncbi:hypothetical protein V8F33_007289 [Rhypophila sp. PSN 637]
MSRSVISQLVLEKTQLNQPYAFTHIVASPGLETTKAILEALLEKIKETSEPGKTPTLIYAVETFDAVQAISNYMKDTGSDMASIIPIKNITQVREDEQGNLLLLCCSTITELIISGGFPLWSITVFDLNYGVPKPTIVVAASCLVTLAQRDLTAMSHVFSVSPYTEGPWDKAAILDSTGVAVQSVQLPSANLPFRTYQKHPTIDIDERFEVADAILRALFFED